MKTLHELRRLLYIRTDTESNDIFLTPAIGSKFTKAQFNKLSRYYREVFDAREHTINNDIVSIELLPKVVG